LGLGEPDPPGFGVPRFWPPAFGCGTGSLGRWTSGTGTKKNAIAAKAKLDTPTTAGKLRFAKGSADLT
jgi:hypothetical protein